MRTFIASKLHGLCATAAGVEYHGSVTIDRNLMDMAGIEPYEQVHVVNLTNGNRWVTYAIPGDAGVFELNGGGALLGEVGHRFIVMTYRIGHRLEPAQVIFTDENNLCTDGLMYAEARP